MSFETIKVDTDIIKQVKVVDIRLKMEWMQTGIVKGSLPISFYDSFGMPSPEKFLKQLDKHIKKDERFAIICRTGNRTYGVGQYLSDLGFDVINLDGGVVELARLGYEFEKHA